MYTLKIDQLSEFLLVFKKRNFVWKGYLTTIFGPYRSGTVGSLLTLNGRDYPLRTTTSHFLFFFPTDRQNISTTWTDQHEYVLHIQRQDLAAAQ